MPRRELGDDVGQDRMALIVGQADPELAAQPLPAQLRQDRIQRLRHPPGDR